MKTMVIPATLALILVMFIASGCASPPSPVLTSPAELEKCEQIANEKIKSKCYLYAGMLQQNAAYCLGANDADSRTCLAFLARAKKDASFCGMIPAGQLPESALTATRDSCYLDFAWKVSLNPNDCDKISYAAAREQCAGYVSIFQDCEKDAKYRIPCYVATALANRDTGYCDKLSNLAHQEDCKAQVHVFLSQLNNDAAECDKISGASQKTACLQGISIMRMDGGALCDNAPAEYRSICLVNYAREWLDAAVCNRMSASGKDNCLSQLAPGLKDVGLCLQIVDDSIKYLCLNFFRGEFGKEVCRTITNENIREECLKIAKA